MMPTSHNYTETLSLMSPSPLRVSQSPAGLPVLGGSLSPGLFVHLHFKFPPTPADKGMAIFLICEMLLIQAEEGIVPINKCESDVRRAMHPRPH